MRLVQCHEHWMYAYTLALSMFSGAGGAPVAEATEGDVPEYDYESDDEHSGLFDLKKLQSSLSENINKGYLESVKHLREMLMAYEWHLHGKELAERK